MLTEQYNWLGARYGEVAKRMPPPELEYGGDEHRAACALFRKQRELMQPASRREIASHLARLRAHYPRKDNTPEAAYNAVAEDFVNDLVETEVSKVALEKAITRWRRGSKPFFPVVGEFLQVIEDITRLERYRLRKLETLAKQSKPPQEAAAESPVCGKTSTDSAKEAQS